MIRQLTYMVIDDQPDAIDLLVSYGQRMPQLKLAGTETNSIRALRQLNDHPVDLLFVDVEMPAMSGIELVQALYPAPLLVLVTGHERFAAKGFELQAVDFLLKPPSFARFAGAVHRACRLYGLPDLPAGSGPMSHTQRDYTYVLAQGESYFQRVDFEEVCYVEAKRNDIRIGLAGQKHLQCRMKISEFYDRLPAQDFVQVHRSFVVNLRLIRAVIGNRLIRLTGTTTEIPIGDNYQSHFFQVWKDLTG